MTIKYQLHARRCDCHPETCCCYSYEIRDSQDRIVAVGDNRAVMENMVRLANLGAVTQQQTQLDIVKGLGGG